MLHTEVSSILHATPSQLVAIYLDFANWHRLFPTISGTRLLRDEHGTKTIEVDHWEGQVINLLTVQSARRVRLEEFKHRFDAVFLNCFEPAAAGSTCYRVLADVRLKGWAKGLQPFLAPYVRRQIRRFVIEPLRRAAETGQTGGPPV
jgi:hypothetical protein